MITQVRKGNQTQTLGDWDVGQAAPYFKAYNSSARIRKVWFFLERRTNNYFQEIRPLLKYFVLNHGAHDWFSNP